MPPLSKILRIDYGALIGAILPVMGWLLAYLNVYQPRLMEMLGAGPFPAWISLSVAGLFSIIGIPLFLHRVRAIRRLFQEGTKVEAEITLAKFWRDRGRVEVRFEHAGAQVETGLALHRTEEAEQLQVGDSVVVRYDPKRPSRIIIPQLFA